MRRERELPRKICHRRWDAQVGWSDEAVPWRKSRSPVKAVRLVIQNREVAMDAMMKFSELNRGLAARTYDGMIGTFMANGLVDEETQKNDLVREVLKVTHEMPIARAGNRSDSAGKFATPPISRDGQFVKV